MANRRLVVAGAVALVVAGGGLLAVMFNERPSDRAVTVVVPADNAVDDAAAIDSVAVDSAAENAEDDAAGDHDAAAETATAADHAPTAEADQAEPAPVARAEPHRLIVVATGIAWDRDLAAEAAAALPPEIVFALPADLPQAAQRLVEWQAAGRDVLIRFAWGQTTDATDAVPLAASSEVQAGRMEAQWARLAAAGGGVIVEPAAAAVLAPLAAGLADATAKLMLVGSEADAPPPSAWRIDAAQLGERGFAAALDRLARAPSDPSVSIVLLELYPALLGPVAAWLHALDGEAVAIAGLSALVEEAP